MRSPPRSGSTPTETRFATNAERVAHRDELIALIEAALRRPGRRALARSCSSSAGVPAGKVRTLDDVYAWEQTRRRAC